MKKTIALIALIPALAFCDAVSTIDALIEQSGWTADELLAALNLMEAKYNRDCQSAQGRVAWHGKKTSEIINTNEMTKVSVYEDGTTFTDRAKIITPKDEAVAYTSALPTNGVPARLANARLRQAQNANTISNVTVVIGN